MKRNRCRSASIVLVLIASLLLVMLTGCKGDATSTDTTSGGTVASQTIAAETGTAPTTAASTSGDSAATSTEATQPLDTESYASPLHTDSLRMNDYIVINPIKIDMHPIDVGPNRCEWIVQISGLADTAVQSAINERILEDVKALFVEFDATPSNPNDRYWFFCHSPFNSNNILSVKIQIWRHRISGNRICLQKALNFDLNTGKQIALRDIFVDGYDYASVIGPAFSQYLSQPEAHGMLPFDGKASFFINETNQSLRLFNSKWIHLSQNFEEFQPIPVLECVDIPFSAFDGNLVFDRFYPSKVDLFEQPTTYYCLARDTLHEAYALLEVEQGEYEGIPYVVECYLREEHLPIVRRIFDENRDALFAQLPPTENIRIDEPLTVQITPSVFGNYVGMEAMIHVFMKAEDSRLVFFQFPTCWDFEGNVYNKRDFIKVDDDTFVQLLTVELMLESENEARFSNFDTATLKEFARQILENGSYRFNSAEISFMFNRADGSNLDTMSIFLPYGRLGIENFTMFNDLVELIRLRTSDN